MTKKSVHSEEVIAIECVGHHLENIIRIVDHYHPDINAKDSEEYANARKSLGDLRNYLITKMEGRNYY